MEIYFALLVVLLISTCVSDETRLQDEIPCHSSDDSPYRFYGTKTTYTNAINHLKRNVRNVSIPNSCSPQMVYLFKRHAIRYPDGKDIPVMKKVLESLRNHIMEAAKSGNVNMCTKDIELLRSWTSKMKPEDDNSITETGFKETESIGECLITRVNV